MTEHLHSMAALSGEIANLRDEERSLRTVLPVQGSADPRIVKREPASRPAEFTLRLVLNVPKSTKRLVQTVEVTLPKEFTHLAQIDVAVASKTDGGD